METMNTDDIMKMWGQMFNWMGGTMTAIEQAQQASIQATMRTFELTANTYARFWGIKPKQVVPSDRRFRDDAWSENVPFDIMKQAYLITSQWLVDMTEGIKDTDPDAHLRVKFWTKQLADALSPSNFLLTNPVVLQEIVRTGGANLTEGMKNFITDVRKGRISQVPADSFEVGKDLAVTPGKVIYRNSLIEIIQYTPSTKKVRGIPIVVVPPWINKYYVMDMRPENSMYKYLVDAGFTLFTISWKNPDKSVLHLDWDDYIEMGLLKALEIAKSVTGSEKVNWIGYCLGGVVLEVTLAYLAAQGDESSNTATYFATHQDFSDSGEISAFLSEREADFLEWLMKASGGYLDNRNMSFTFNMLRSNDLLWHYVVNNYLMGKQPPAFDLLYWNSDGTRVPGKVHSYLIRNFFLANKLREPDALQVKGVNIDTRRITTPTYCVAAIGDHIVPWQGTYTMNDLVSGPMRFILTKGGHIAGIINHPDKKKRAYWTNDSKESDPDVWLEGATEHPGSWWVDWIPYLKKRSGKLVELPETGNETYPPLMDAPGTYVLEK
jgi:polyhydroxyalkanoate synthase